MIVVVDRIDGPLASSKSALSREGAEVKLTASADEALELLRSHAARLVVFTFDLGSMLAPEFCRIVREADLTKGVSLLFVSERGSEDVVDLCMAAGCNDILAQPFRPEELDEKIRKLTEVPARGQLRTLTKVEVGLSSGSYFRLGHSLNISASGIYLEMDHVLPPEAKVRVQFYLRGDNTPVHVDAEVIRAEFFGATPRYGMRFLSMAEQDRIRVQRFVTRLRARELN